VVKPKNIPLPSSVARRVRGLLARTSLRELRRAAEKNGVRAWIVGGAPRDLWLRRPILDVDVVVEGDALALARRLERRRVGRLVTLSAEPPRVFRLAGGSTEIDVAEVERGSITADLGRRDFTVNAMAIPLSGGRLLDPFGGLQDIRKRRLRAVAAGNFVDDPLRTLRAPRLMASHSLSPDRALLRICRDAAPGLAHVAPERVRSELSRLLDADRVEPALAWAARAGLLGPAFARKVTKRVARRFARREIPCDAPAIRRRRPANRRAVRLALIAGALGLSPQETARWLAARRFRRSEAGEVARLCGLLRQAQGSRTIEDQWRWIRDAGALAPEALALLASVPGSPRRLAASLASRLRRARPLPRLSGADVLAWTGLAPGPEVGRLLAELEVAALSGRFRTRREGRKWLLRQAPAIIRSS
jgi:tRNA nucleotidyltransferase (CCA-adding enzyme)